MVIAERSLRRHLPTSSTESTVANVALSTTRFLSIILLLDFFGSRLLVEAAVDVVSEPPSIISIRWNGFVVVDADADAATVDPVLDEPMVLSPIVPLLISVPL